MIALALGGIGQKSQPIEVLDYPPVEFRTRTFAIVVLDPEADRATERSRHTPDINRIDNVAEMQPAGGRRGESSDWRSVETFAESGEHEPRLCARGKRATGETGRAEFHHGLL